MTCACDVFNIKSQYTHQMYSLVVKHKKNLSSLFSSKMVEVFWNLYVSTLSVPIKCRNVNKVEQFLKEFSLKRNNRKIIVWKLLYIKSTDFKHVLTLKKYNTFMLYKS